MFEILSDEIYNGDSYVFLRELLQNSIDAIRMRGEVLKSEGIESKNLGTISVNVEHGDNGDAIITWHDDGIGMDEYIIKNYLTIAGKSYYRSLDFERQGLKMDPISKFGIGILSCFVAAERIEIETFRDPYLFSEGDRFKIKIPAINRQFRIEKLPQQGANVGTTVKVFVEGKKIQLDDESKSIKPLDVTGYLSIVAGFVEFPIVITEGNQKTVVLHPKQDAEAASQRFGEEYKVHQLNLSYPLSEAILPQDLSNAREMLKEERWDISSNLGLEGYDGIFSYLVPINNDVDLMHNYDGTMILNKGELTLKKVRSGKHSNKYNLSKIVGLSRSSTHSMACAVYRDGILLSEIFQPRNFDYEYLSLLRPRIVVNLPKKTSSRVNLARSTILGQLENWYVPIYNSYQNNILNVLLKELLKLDPAERLYQLGRLIAFYNIEIQCILRVFPHESWPLPFLEEGDINVLEWKDVKNDILYSSPNNEIIDGELKMMVNHKLLTKSEYDGFLVRWNGEKCIVNNDAVSGRIGNCISLITVENLVQHFVNKFYDFVDIRFLHSPIEGCPPLLQKVWSRKKESNENPEIELLLKKTVDNPTLLNHEERRLLISNIGSPFRNRIPEFIEFPNSFEQFFAYGNKMLNLKHPATQALLRFIASLALSKIRRTLPENRIGDLEDTLLRCLENFDSFNREDIPNSLHELWPLVQKAKLFEIGEIDNLVLEYEDFVPGTLDFIDIEEIKKNFSHIHPQFGMPI